MYDLDIFSSSSYLNERGGGFVRSFSKASAEAGEGGGGYRNMI